MSIIVYKRICISVLKTGVAAYYFPSDCQMPRYVAVFLLQTVATDELDSTVRRDVIMTITPRAGTLDTQMTPSVNYLGVNTLFRCNGS